ncbi:ion transporter [Lacisediminimonas profundi]|uniref:ion transporter n=1 Tax=Lacisediminimonas profundi TaxID=2603856 RepID=UPI00124BB109|nr:ion transporter [Lacisediminimonas profundi]
MTEKNQPSPAASDPRTRLGKPDRGWRRTMYAVIFESDTRAGRMFDLVLIGAILLSVLVVMLDSVQAISSRHSKTLNVLEWLFTIAFSVEYLARLACVRNPMRYAFSFFGIIDMLSILPTYLALLVPGTEVLLDIRILRLLRVFRILRLTEYVEEYGLLGQALLASRRKILIFLSVVMMIVLIMGTIMYIVEGPASGFTSIPTAIYWSITAVTTVGFGDVVPKTDLGRAIASVMMLIGWGILAVPTGIISSEMTAQRFGRVLTSTRRCQHCLSEGQETSARFCKDCGAAMDTAET